MVKNIRKTEQPYRPSVLGVIAVHLFASAICWAFMALFFYALVNGQA